MLAGQALLEELCVDRGKEMCAQGAMIRRVASARFDYHHSDREWTHLGQVAAFMTFHGQGGDPDTPTNFDWNGKAFTRASLSLLQKLAIGSCSDIYDQILRGRQRLAGASVSEVEWDSWKQAHTDELHHHTSQGGVSQNHFGGRPRSASRSYDEFKREGEREVVDETFAILLSKVLKPQEAVWLIRRYRDGEPTVNLAKDLVTKDTRYQSEGGLTRAVQYIDVVVHRAKKKAREKLPAVWASLAKETA